VQLTKFGHCCVRLQVAGTVLVIDPGCRTEDAALDGADAVLVTHEHFDHFAESRLRAAAAANPRLRIWTVTPVAEMLHDLGPQVRAVGHGERFRAGGVRVQAYGSWHAPVHPEIPVVANTGFLVAASVFHPGDALTVPDRPVNTLLIPAQASWMRLSDVIDWVRQVAPRRVVVIHDSDLNADGLAAVDGLLGRHGPGIGAEYVRLDRDEVLRLA
jgi:L-ascorbate metabolism protein UlaG (beta-lactamase superfamily)